MIPGNTRNTFDQRKGEVIINGRDNLFLNIFELKFFFLFFDDISRWIEKEDTTIGEYEFQFYSLRSNLNKGKSYKFNL